MLYWDKRSIILCDKKLDKRVECNSDLVYGNNVTEESKECIQFGGEQGKF